MSIVDEMMKSGTLTEKQGEAINEFIAEQLEIQKKAAVEATIPVATAACTSDIIQALIVDKIDEFVSREVNQRLESAAIQAASLAPVNTLQDSNSLHVNTGVQYHYGALPAYVKFGSEHVIHEVQYTMSISQLTNCSGILTESLSFNNFQVVQAPDGSRYLKAKLI